MRLYSKLPVIQDWKAAVFDAKKGIEVEPEFGALLYALVRIVKPRVCIETGTYIGDSAEWIGKGLRDNGMGLLVTCDTNEEYVIAARKRFEGLPIQVTLQDGRQLIEQAGMMDFVHLDGGDPALRLEQLKLIGNQNISPGGMVTWHDAVVWCPDMYDYFSSTYDWPHLLIPTPVGVAVFQRPPEGAG